MILQLIMELTLAIALTIGSLETGLYSADSAIMVDIDRSVERLAATATITLPLTSRLQAANDEELATYVPTAKQFKVGDPVSITLGYSEYMRKEFTGFVRYIQPGQNELKVICEDTTFKLRKNTIKKTFKKTTLEELVTFLVKDFDIEIEGRVPVINFENYPINGVSSAVALQYLIDTYGLSMYFDLENKLHVGLRYTERRGNDVYVLHGDKDNDANVVDYKNLKWRTKEEKNLSIEAVFIKQDNTKLQVEVGDIGQGSKITRYYYGIAGSDTEIKAKLTEMAEADLSQMSFDGYEGSFTAYSIPFVDPGYSIDLYNYLYPEYDGQYFVKATRLSWGATVGSHRTITPGIKL